MDMMYPALPNDGKHYIRLLDISAGPGRRNRDFLCKFDIVCLDNPPLYTAISYCWGDPTEVARIKLPDGQSLPLSQTLSDLLTSLQKRCTQQRHTNFKLWIDALSINQQDTTEKASQVRWMGNVFASAEKVILWLGDSDDISRKALLSIKSHGTDQSSLQRAFSLPERPWFQRVWVIQEIAVARKIQVVCGENCIPFKCFATCINAIWNSFEGLSEYSHEDAALRGLWSVTRLIDIRHEFQKKREVCYETLLQAAFHCEATDKRDMVFAFRNIGDGRLSLQPNYTITEEQVYTQATKELLCRGQCLDILALAGIYGREHPSSLLTWAPDLRYYSYSEPFVPCNSAGWKAGGHLRVSPQLESPFLLRLQAKTIGVVDITCPPFNCYSVADQQAAFAAVLALRLRLPGDITEEQWLNGLVSTLIWGLDIDDAPLHIGKQEWLLYRKDFLDWVKWLQSSSCQDDLDKIRQNKYHRTIEPRIDSWMAFMTHSGFLCIGPQAVV